MVLSHLKHRNGRRSQPLQTDLQAKDQAAGSVSMPPAKSQSSNAKSTSLATSKICLSTSRLVLLGVLAVSCSVLALHFALKAPPNSDAVIVNDQSAMSSARTSQHSNSGPPPNEQQSSSRASTATASQPTPASTKSRRKSRPTVTILGEFPHDQNAFTQGLLVYREPSSGQKVLIESTGLYGQSTVRKVDMQSGRVLQSQRIPDDLFGEGIALVNDQIAMLTWKSNRGLLFDVHDLQETGSFGFNTVTGEGWGMDCDGTTLVISDGSSYLQFWDPRTLKSVHQVQVTLNEQPVNYLNELELAKGFVYANVWYQHVIIKIDPQSGNVLSVFDCSDLVRQANYGTTKRDAVLNGIAYDEDQDVFYLTGKLWDRVFKVKLQD